MGTVRFIRDEIRAWVGLVGILVAALSFMPFRFSEAFAFYAFIQNMAIAAWWYYGRKHGNNWMGSWVALYFCGFLFVTAIGSFVEYPWDLVRSYGTYVMPSATWITIRHASGWLSMIVWIFMTITSLRLNIACMIVVSEGRTSPGRLRDM